jgi:hypothetical protein
MNGGIYLIHDDGWLVEMNEEHYDSEDLLQGLLARYPNLLAGDQNNRPQGFRSFRGRASRWMRRPSTGWKLVRGTSVNIGIGKTL